MPIGDYAFPGAMGLGVPDAEPFHVDSTSLIGQDGSSLGNAGWLSTNIGGTTFGADATDGIGVGGGLLLGIALSQSVVPSGVGMMILQSPNFDVMPGCLYRLRAAFANLTGIQSTDIALSDGTLITTRPSGPDTPFSVTFRPTAPLVAIRLNAVSVVATQPMLIAPIIVTRIPA